MDLYFGQEVTIDLSTGDGTRWDANIVGFRAEETFGWNAEPYVRVGAVQKVLGL